MLRILAALLVFYCAVFGQHIESVINCSDCHSTAIAEWQASRHANSTAKNNRFYSIMYQMARESASDTLSVLCEKCHNPISSLEKNKKIDPHEGINCDFCHATKLVIGAWFQPGIENTKYGPLRDAISNSHSCEYSSLHEKSEFCLVCHGQMVNDSGIAFCSTQDEYYNSDFAKDGITCQDCHMPSRVGKAAPLGKIREELHSHGFYGGYSSGMLRNCARVELNCLKNMDNVQVEINVANHSIGHALPTGSPMRLVILNVEALNNDGLIVWRNIYNDALKEDSSAVFMRLLQDADGNAPVPPWQAQSVRFDNRLLPDEKRTLFYTIADTTTVKIRASLLYYLAPKKILKKLKLYEPIYTDPKTITTVTVPVVSVKAP
ncbi:hypothetical protein JW935_20605 [candidate division KSB1 bacterium]|nr:hypothetical protein [candidate division KSB1 bacterium]